MAAFLLTALMAITPVPTAAPMAEVPILTRTVERGEPLSAADFAIEKRGVGLARGAVPVAAAVGQEAARRLAAGSVVRETDLARPQIVHRGETVNIAFRAGALSITTRGRALTGGGVGEPVRVVSLATNRTLDAMIEGSGRVRLTDQ